MNPKRRLHAILGCDRIENRRAPGYHKGDVEDFLQTHPRSAAARLRPKMGMTGDLWLAFIGPNLREGAAGLGGTPRDALEDFNRRFMEPVISRNGSEPH